MEQYNETKAASERFNTFKLHTGFPITTAMQNFTLQNSSLVSTDTESLGFLTLKYHPKYKPRTFSHQC